MPKLPLPEDQPVAVNALRNKRAEITGQIAMFEREVARLRAELVHVDATLRLFDDHRKVGARNVRSIILSSLFGRAGIGKNAVRGPIGYVA
jgi:hypothetical protein